VPNGQDEEMDAVRQRSRIWGVIWAVGDLSYYVGLITSIILPIVVIMNGIREFDSLLGFAKSLSIAVLFLVLCFPFGLGLCIILKWCARKCTGVARSGA
jgi:hypothetical protein